MTLTFGDDEPIGPDRRAAGASLGEGRDGRCAMSSPAELAERLAKVIEAPSPQTRTERSLAECRLRVSPPELRLLAHAIDNAGRPDGAAVITYAAQTGGVHRRRIRDIVLAGDRVYAFCELRQGEREFLLRGILAVEPR